MAWPLAEFLYPRPRPANTAPRIATLAPANNVSASTVESRCVATMGIVASDAPPSTPPAIENPSASAPSRSAFFADTCARGTQRVKLASPDQPYAPAISLPCECMRKPALYDSVSSPGAANCGVYVVPAAHDAKTSNHVTLMAHHKSRGFLHCV